MDLNTLIPWVLAANTIMTFGTAIYSFLTSGAKAANAALGSLKEKIEVELAAIAEARQKQTEAIIARFTLTESRILKLESDMTHLPDREQMHRLELAVERLTGRMETLDERLKPVASVSDRLQEFLLEQARTSK